MHKHGFQNVKVTPGMVVHVGDPRTWEGMQTDCCRLEANLSYSMRRDPVKTRTKVKETQVQIRKRPRNLTKSVSFISLNSIRIIMLGLRKELLSAKVANELN